MVSGGWDQVSQGGFQGRAWLLPACLGAPGGGPAAGTGRGLRARVESAWLPDPYLAEQGPVDRGCLVVPGSGGDESGQACVEDRDVGGLVSDDAVDLGPQPAGRGGVGELRGPRLAGQRVDLGIAELGPVLGAGRVS